MSFGDDIEDTEVLSPFRVGMRDMNAALWAELQTDCPLKAAEAKRIYLALTREARLSVLKENLESRGTHVPPAFL